jgi:hypothetical protein
LHTSRSFQGSQLTQFERCKFAWIRSFQDADINRITLRCATEESPSVALAIGTRALQAASWPLISSSSSRKS